MASWSFLTNHARVLLCIARDADVRLRDLAAEVGITERRAQDIVGDLSDAGYLVKEKAGRRNNYRIREHLPLPERLGRPRPIGEVLDLLVAAEGPSREGRRSRPDAPDPSAPSGSDPAQPPR